MLDFLKRMEITEEVINEITNTYTADEIISLQSNQDECLKTIALFRRLGINNIPELLIHERYIFFKLTMRIVNEIEKYDIPELVKNINNDYTYIEKII